MTKQKFNKYINALLDLAKIRITFFVSVSTSIGFILNSGSVNSKMVISAIGVFLLAAGSSALNHYQERRFDALMERTKSRPIPSGFLTPAFALVYAIVLSVLGSLILGLFINTTALILGLVALIWYNLFYTLGLCRRKHFGYSSNSVSIVLFYLADSSFLVTAYDLWQGL